MNEVVSNRSLDEVKMQFNCLIDNMTSLIEEVKPKTDIKKTKLWKIREDLEQINTLEYEETSHLLGIITKYNMINILFESDVIYDKKELLKLIEGNINYVDDSNQEYNNVLFELSMAIRFISSNSKKYEIQLGGGHECDIIIDNDIAIECKYIHSHSNLEKNISRAKKQINKRIEEQKAKKGYIALDFSNIIDKEKLNSFISYTFEIFKSNYSKMKGNKSDITKSITNDGNFKKIIQSILTHEIELLLYEKITTSYDLGENTKAIMYQTNYTMMLEDETSISPIPIRSLCFFLNQKNTVQDNKETLNIINSLAVGI
jgi:hypothetical protein